MAQVINTNIMSLNAQRQLNKSQSTQNEAMERLSSGLRINSAKDDAAGLAISTNMSSQISGITQAVRNSNDGISMAQTAEGSMDEMTSILQRMRELAVQSSNDTNSDSNRKAIQQEVDQLHSELDRIAQTTEFNGVKLLDGSAGQTTLQIGANSGQTLSFSINSVTTNAMGLNGGLNKTDLNSGRITGALAANDLAINGVIIDETDPTTGTSANDIADAINIKTAETGVIASSYNVIQGDNESTTVTGITDGLEVTIGTGSTITLGATSSMSNLVETINRDIDGLTASVGDSGELIMTNDTGEDILIGGGQDASSGVNSGLYKGYLSLDSGDDTPIEVSGALPGQAGFTAANGSDSVIGVPNTVISTGITEADAIVINGVDITAADYTDEAGFLAHLNSFTEVTGVSVTGTAATGFQFAAKDGVGVEISSNSASQESRTEALTKLGLQGEMGGKVIEALSTNVSTMKGASNTMEKLDIALGHISDSRAKLGAIQNRLSSTISNLENVSQNLSASNSRIADADFAAETSKMSKSQILQQAGTSMLAQANASSENVLSLLQ